MPAAVSESPRGCLKPEQREAKNCGAADIVPKQAGDLLTQAFSTYIAGDFTEYFDELLVSGVTDTLKGELSRSRCRAPKRMAP